MQDQHTNVRLDKAIQVDPVVQPVEIYNHTHTNTQITKHTIQSTVESKEMVK